MNENNNAKVSVLIAIYNIEKFVDKCVRSIIEQTYKNIEIILVDDCSTDSSGRRCDYFAAKDRRVLTVHHNANTRQSGVRNTGLANATGEYIVFVDGDDWLAPDFIEYMVNLIVKTKSDMAISRYNFTSRDFQQANRDKTEIWTPEKATIEFILPNLSVGCWNKIYRRDCIERYSLRFNTEAFTAEGQEFIIKCAQHVNHVAVGCRKVYYYRLNNAESAVTKPDLRQPKGSLETFVRVKGELIIKTPGILNALRYHTWINNFWMIRTVFALNLQRENNDLLINSISYVRRYGFSLLGLTVPFATKIFFMRASLAPVWSAKFVNWRHKIRFQKDRTE